MPPKEAKRCRTCYLTRVSNFYPLNERLDKERFAAKTLADLLWEVAKIEIKENHERSLPMDLCGNCSRKLKNAYSFVQQAQQVNEWLLANGGELNVTKAQRDCLVEAPIDIPEQVAPVKEELCEDVYAQHTHTAAVTTGKQVEVGKDEGLKEEMAQDETASSSGAGQMKIDPITVAEISWQNDDDQEHFDKDENHNDDADSDEGVKDIKKKVIADSKESDDAYEPDTTEESESESDEDDYTEKPRRGRSQAAECRKMFNTENEFIGTKENARFRCGSCDKSFSWKKDLQRHAETHFSEPQFTCDYCGRQFRRKDKLKDHLKSHARRSNNVISKRVQRHPEWIFAERLYMSQNLRISCKLCGGGFPSTVALREHIKVHEDRQTLNLQQDSDVVKELYPQINSPEQLEELKSSISEDISQQRYAKYYAVVNSYGYEVSLSDSDADGEGQAMENSESAGAAAADKYKCELCEQTFDRKYAIFKHMTQEHILDDLPYKCTVCKLDFVCNRMFTLHVRTQCRSKEKKYRCLKCPGKFMWLENLEGHQCSNKFNTPEYKAQLPLKRDVLSCNVCSKTFVWVNDLKRHQESHTVDGLPHECHLCPQRFRKFENLRQHMRQTHEQLKRRLECNLCGYKSETLGQLRTHLQQHADGCTGIDLLQGRYFKVYWPHGIAGHEAELTNSIQTDFVAQSLDRYYAAVDESGNELDINDSETELDTEMEVDNCEAQTQAPASQPLSRYTCDECDKVFTRRKRVLLHQYTEHSDLQKSPHSCPECERQFVCEALLLQHQSRDCKNAIKRFHCSKCSARFMWEENLQQHMQLKHIDPEQRISRQLANKLQCDECDKVFIWPKDLIRHKRVHLPEDEKFECDYCDKKFNRRDNLRSHLKTHGAAAAASAKKRTKKEHRRVVKSKGLDMNLCKPHGVKCIQCMICLSKHSKISDLRTHLRTHQYVVSFAPRTESINDLSALFYPDEPLMEESKLMARISADIASQQFHSSFYSITNEMGYELDLDSSETESDSEQEDEGHKEDSGTYVCELCDETFSRKYKIFNHQNETHSREVAPYACEICNTGFLSRDLLQWHYQQLCKNNVKRFLCRKCQLRFMWKENLKIHLRMSHPELGEGRKKPSDTLECSECNRTFTMQKDLTRHMAAMHRGESAIFKCIWCPRQFYKRLNLHRHIVRHGIGPEQLEMAKCHVSATSGPNGAKQIYCRVCNLQFNTISALRNHLNQEANSPLSTHHNYNSLQTYSIINERGFELQIDDSETDDDQNKADQRGSYTCGLCTLACKRKYEIALHQRSVHKQEELPFKCDKCIFRTVSDEILNHHMRTQCYNNEKLLQCYKCELKFMWRENLDIHKQILHPPEETVEENAANEADYHNAANSTPGKKFQCDRCARCYNRKDRLNTHIKKMHTEGGDTADAEIRNKAKSKTPASTSEQSKTVMEKKYLCAFCGRALTSSSNLIIHMRRHTGEKPFKCEFCDMAFPRSSDLCSHRRTHTGEKPHRCTVCDKAFSRSYKLHTHMRIHSGERPYKCTYCEKGFTQSNDLTLHVRRHTGERPYVCGICGERFIQGTALKNHRILKHYENVEPAGHGFPRLEQFNA